MAHPYRDAAHKNDPSWLRGIQPFVEKATDADVTATIRNYGGDAKTTAKAAYEPKEEK
jgi:hypothetical protein